jgi:1-aminocyclopropane-1-carboxylate deaminase/D-cysteine desulfhydrase-like pyridoxal-dependent ACC family enzyme
VRFDHLVVAIGSGGTQAGMVAGRAPTSTAVLGITWGPWLRSVGTVLDLARLSAAYLSLRIASARGRWR